MSWLFGERPLIPVQRELDEILSRVDRVRVLTLHADVPELFARAFPDPILLDTKDTEAIKAFRQSIAIVEDPHTFGRCSCIGCPAFELYAGQEVLATISLQHGRAIRWNRWKCDAQLRSGKALMEWLTTHGVESGVLDVLVHTRFAPFAPSMSAACDFQNV